MSALLRSLRVSALGACIIVLAVVSMRLAVGETQEERRAIDLVKGLDGRVLWNWEGYLEPVLKADTLQSALYEKV